MSTFSIGFWAWLLLGIEVLLVVSATVHVVLHKRDVRAAVGWTGLIWLAPYLGAVLYALLGINRIERRAHRLRPQPASRRTADRNMLPLADPSPFTDSFPELALLSQAGEQLTGFPLTTGSRVEPLVNGDQGYHAMLEAISHAQHSIALASYIFDNDRAGNLFLDALATAQQRGVAVRVLIDGMGQHYSKPPMPRLLRERDIPTGLFLESTLPLRNPYFNLRNHRKILVVDGRVGFTGGLNIRESCLLELNPEHPTQDLHFRLEGNVVRSLTDTFAQDWEFTTGESLTGEGWYPQLAPTGSSYARGIADGPDEDFETIYHLLLAALAEARQRVRILSPYFLPDPTLIAALNVAVLRGIEVEILVPEKSNLRFVHWAAAAQAGQLLAGGCRIVLTRPPFDHTKLMLVDNAWCLFGSANWDSRSLRLNFEFNVECYDQALSTWLHQFVDEKVRSGRELTPGELQARPWSHKIRDGMARLFSPYL